MRNRLVLASIILTIVFGLLFLFTACGKKEANGEDISPYAESSFQAVTTQLNPGGSFYLYAGTGQVVRWVNDLFDFLLSPEGIGSMGEKSSQAISGITWIRSLLTESGLLSIDGIGVSTVPIDKDLHHSTIVIHRGARSAADLISQCTQKSEGPLDALSLLPSDTVFATFSDHSLPVLWHWLDKQIESSGIEEMKTGWNQMKSGLLESQIDMETLLSSLGSQLGLVITLDQQKTFSLPDGDQSTQVPIPGMAFILDTQNDSLFSLLQKNLPMASFKEKNGQKTLSMPKLPLPFELEVQIRQNDKRLIIASSGSLLETLCGHIEKGQLLRDSPEFKELSRHMPSQGNGFRYLSPRLWSSISQIIQDKMTQQKDAGDTSAAAGMGFLKRLLPAKLALYSVLRHQGDSINIKMNHTFSTGHLMLIPAVSSIGIVSAIAIPNLIKAREKAKQLNPDILDQPGGVASDLQIDVPDESDIE